MSSTGFRNIQVTSRGVMPHQPPASLSQPGDHVVYAMPWRLPLPAGGQTVPVLLLLSLRRYEAVCRRLRETPRLTQAQRQVLLINFLSAAQRLPSPAGRWLLVAPLVGHVGSRRLVLIPAPRWGMDVLCAKHA